MSTRVSLIGAVLFSILPLGCSDTPSATTSTPIVQESKTGKEGPIKPKGAGATATNPEVISPGP